MQLRNYQQHAIERVIDELRSVNSTLVVMPTGTGKTVLFSHLASHYMQHGRVMVLAHREELIRQAANKIVAATGYQPAIEMAGEWSIEDGLNKPKIVVSSVQTLCHGRVERFNPAEFALVITDECFPAGTLVDGRPIETIKVGDVVKSFNHATGKVEMKKVLHCMKRRCRSMAVVNLSNGKKIKCTFGHPFWMREINQYMQAVLLWKGDVLTTHDGDVIVESVETFSEDMVVYNIEVEDNNNYFAEKVLVHNCHHAPAQSYRTVFNHILSAGAKHVGVTATPDRTDELALGQLFSTVAYDYDLQQAIEDGWLVPINQKIVHVKGLDYSKVSMMAGDLNQKDVAKAQANEEILHKMIDPIVELAAGRKTIVFATPGSKKATDNEDGFHIAERMTEIFNRHSPDCARRVAQDTDKVERRQILQDYAEGKFQFLVNVGVLTEGFDDPSIKVVAITRPTKSRSLFCQMVGRGTRPLPGIVDLYNYAHIRRSAIKTSDKPGVDIIDMVGNSGRHKLVTMADVLGGKYSDQVVEKVKKKLEASAKPVDVDEELKLAKEEIRAEYEKAARKVVVGKAKFEVGTVDPFDAFDLTPIRERVWDKGKPPTPSQLATLKNLGIPFDNRLTRSKAGQLIGEAYRRRDEGLASYKQIASGESRNTPTIEIAKRKFAQWGDKYKSLSTRVDME